MSLEGWSLEGTRSPSVPHMPASKLFLLGRRDKHAFREISSKRRGPYRSPLYEYVMKWVDREEFIKSQLGFHREDIMMRFGVGSNSGENAKEHDTSTSVSSTNKDDAQELSGKQDAGVSLQEGGEKKFPAGDDVRLATATSVGEMPRFFYIFRILMSILDVTTHPLGAYIDARVYVPRAAFFRNRVKIKGFAAKMATLGKVSRALHGLMQALQFYADDPPRALQQLIPVCAQLATAQNQLAFAIDYIRSVDQAEVTQWARYVREAAACGRRVLEDARVVTAVRCPCLNQRQTPVSGAESRTGAPVSGTEPSVGAPGNQHMDVTDRLIGSSVDGAGLPGAPHTERIRDSPPADIPDHTHGDGDDGSTDNREPTRDDESEGSTGSGPHDLKSEPLQQGNDDSPQPPAAVVQATESAGVAGSTLAVVQATESAGVAGSTLQEEGGRSTPQRVAESSRSQEPVRSRPPAPTTPVRGKQCQHCHRWLLTYPTAPPFGPRARSRSASLLPHSTVGPPARQPRAPAGPPPETADKVQGVSRAAENKGEVGVATPQHVPRGSAAPSSLRLVPNDMDNEGQQQGGSSPEVVGVVERDSGLPQAPTSPPPITQRRPQPPTNAPKLKPQPPPSQPPKRVQQSSRPPPPKPKKKSKLAGLASSVRSLWGRMRSSRSKRSADQKSVRDPSTQQTRNRDSAARGSNVSSLKGVSQQPSHLASAEPEPENAPNGKGSAAGQSHFSSSLSQRLRSYGKRLAARAQQYATNVLASTLSPSQMAAYIDSMAQTLSLACPVLLKIWKRCGTGNPAALLAVTRSTPHPHSAGSAREEGGGTLPVRESDEARDPEDSQASEANRIRLSSLGQMVAERSSGYVRTASERDAENLRFAQATDTVLARVFLYLYETIACFFMHDLVRVYLHVHLQREADRFCEL